LGRERIIFIGEEAMALESINTGTPMALNATRRAIRKEIATLATFCAEVVPTHADER
jgi:hypothetical protein